MKKYLQLIRIKHWVKNLLIFVPIICGKALNCNNILTIILGFIAFSFGASFIYIINDIKDIEQDKLHERKKERPLAKGIIKKRDAIILAIIMLILSLGINSVINGNVLNLSNYILIAYIIINILYSFYLKKLVIIDVLLLSIGFVLRVYYGASLVDIIVSDYLFLTIFSASLFLSLGKRKKELINNSLVRATLKDYNKSFLDNFQNITLTLTLIFYSLWAKEQVNPLMIYTVILIVIIFMRYYLIVEKQDEGDPTTVFYSDKLLIILCLLYGFIMFGILMF